MRRYRCTLRSQSGTVRLQLWTITASALRGLPDPRHVAKQCSAFIKEPSARQCLCAPPAQSSLLLHRLQSLFRAAHKAATIAGAWLAAEYRPMYAPQSVLCGTACPLPDVAVCLQTQHRFKQEHFDTAGCPFYNDAHHNSVEVFDSIRTNTT